MFLLPTSPCFLHELTPNTSCIVASIARLSYAVKYVQVNIEGNYEVNFAGRSPQGRILYARLNRIGPVVNMIMWSGIEACASNICANLPCYAPLLKRGSSVRYIVSSLRSVLKSPHSLFSRHTSPKNTFVEITSAERLANEPRGTHVEGNIHHPTQGFDLELGQMRT